MNNITKEYLIKASDRIILEGIPKNANSTTYDVIYNDCLLPPKLIISYANKYINGEELDRTTFEDGLNTKCFNLLEENGFKIIKKIDIKKQFEEYLRKNTSLSCKSITNYTGALKGFNELSIKLNLGEMSCWKSENIKNNQEKLLEDMDFKEKDRKGKNMYSNSLNYYVNFLLNKKNYISMSTPKSFSSSTFQSSLSSSNLSFHPQLITRYIASLATKPFVLLSGLSGSGKTKLAQAFAMWICENESQYKIVPVGADWTNREPLLGYVNALNNEEYILPENGVLNLLIEADKNQKEYDKDKKEGCIQQGADKKGYRGDKKDVC